MTEFLTVEGGTLAYELSGSTGPLLVLAHGMGDSRQAYRFLTPVLVEAGYRVAELDLRGHGESSVGWSGHSRTDIAGDLISLVEHLGGRRSWLVTPSPVGLPRSPRRRPRSWSPRWSSSRRSPASSR